MVSVGTVISLIAGGAIIAGGIAVLSNLDRIGGAFTRGVETNITNPFSIFLDNLFKTSPTSTQPTQQGPQQGPSSVAGETIPLTESPINTTQVFIPGDTTVQPSGVVTSDTPPILILTPEEKESASFIQKANVSQSDLALGREGFYYFNVVGSEFDTQQFLSSESAIQLSMASIESLFNPGGLTNIKFLGKAPLQEAGFKLFGESQGYL